MDLKIALDHRAQVEQFRHKYRPGLVTLLFTDMVGSTKLNQALGDRDAVALMHAPSLCGGAGNSQPILRRPGDQLSPRTARRWPLEAKIGR